MKSKYPAKLQDCTDEPTSESGGISYADSITDTPVLHKAEKESLPAAKFRHLYVRNLEEIGMEAEKGDRK
jgi:hypothetical protein